MKRYLMSVFAVAALASAASAQEPARHAKGAKHNATATVAKKAPRARPISTGDVDRGGPGYSEHATPRDWVRADDTRCDDLCQRERMLDAKYGKDRERKP